MKLMRRTGCLWVVASLILSLLFTGCGADKADETQQTETGLSGKKIGMTLLIDDGLFGAMYDYVEMLAEAAGVELVCDIGAFSSEAQIESVKNLIADGCDGIMYDNFGEDSLIEIARICDEAEVFWVQYCRDIMDQDVLNILNNSEYYIGRTVENNFNSGAGIADEFHKKGFTKTAIIGPTPGDSTTEKVSEGFKAKAQEYGMEILAEIRNCEDFEDGKKAAEVIIESFPETEAIIVLSGATGKLEGVLSGLENMDGLGDVAIGAVDSTETIADDIEAGYVDICYTGQYIDPGFSFAILLNAVAGTPLSEDKIVIIDRHIALRSKEDAENYRMYVENTEDGIYAFTGEEFRRWLKIYNPDADVELIQEAASAYSIDDVIERHGGN